jgi:Domain of unknown function (DUF4203)
MGAAVAGIILGLLELFFGRRLFWIFVAIGGFLIGWFLAPAIWPSLVTWERIVIGLVLGVVFALLSLVFLRVMVALGGFFLFGAAAVVLIRYLGAEATAGSASYWAAYIIGGAAGAVLLFVLLDWALIVLTSLAGAGAVAQGLVYVADTGRRWVEPLLFVILAAIGITFQGWSFARGRQHRLP